MAAIIAAAVHAALIVVLIPRVVQVEPPPKTTPRPKPQPPRTLVVRAVRNVPDALKKLRKRPKPRPKPKKKPRPKPPEKKRIRVQKIVMQETNERLPTKPTRYISDRANRTEKETRARKTVKLDALPGNVIPTRPRPAATPDPHLSRHARHEDAKTKKRRQKPSPALAMATPRPRRARPRPPKPSPAPTSKPPERVTPERPPDPKGILPKRPERSPVVRQNPDPSKQPAPKVDPRSLFAVQSGDYQKVFGDAPRVPEHARRPQRRRMRMFGRLEKRQRALKASLENMIPEIQAGNHTSVNAHPSVYAGYVHAIHSHIHARWADTFLALLDTQYPRSHPMQDATLNATLEFVINAKSGKFERVSIVRSSGQLQFDAEAVSVAQSIGARPNPPPQIVSPNGKVYVHWNFYRDGRQCGVYHVNIYIRTHKGHMRRTATPGLKKR